MAKEHFDAEILWNKISRLAPQPYRQSVSELFKLYPSTADLYRIVKPFPILGDEVAAERSLSSDAAEAALLYEFRLNYWFVGCVRNDKTIALTLRGAEFVDHTGIKVVARNDTLWLDMRAILANDPQPRKEFEKAPVVVGKALAVGGRMERRGPKPRDFWPKVLGYAAGWLGERGSAPSRQVELQKVIADRIASLGGSAADSTIQGYAREMLVGYQEQLNGK